MRIDWIENRTGLWGLLAVIIAALTLLTSTYFYFNKNTESSDKDIESSNGRSQKKGDKSSDRGVINYLPPSPTESTALQRVEKTVIDGEVFQACDISGLFLTASNTGQSIASLGRKHGAFFNQDGEILRDHTILRDNPLRLSMDCSLAITEVYDVQGHSSFKMLIERRNK